MKQPKVILDYDAYLTNHPQEMKRLGDVTVVTYRAGHSHPYYSMCDTVAMAASPTDDLGALYGAALKAAPLAKQALFYGKGMGNDPSRDTNLYAICEDRDYEQQKQYMC